MGGVTGVQGVIRARMSDQKREKLSLLIGHKCVLLPKGCTVGISFLLEELLLLGDKSLLISHSRQ